MECCDEVIIVKEIINGSQEHFCIIYEKYYSPLYRFSFHIIMREEARDIVHDVFVKLWESRKTLPLTTNLKTYLYSSVKNRSFDYLRHLGVEDRNQHKIVEAMLFVEDHWDEDEDNEIHIKLNRCIDKLPLQQQNVIRLKADGKSYQEIAEKLNISVKTVNNHIIKAYHYIRDNILTISIILTMIKNNINLDRWFFN